MQRTGPAFVVIAAATAAFLASAGAAAAQDGPECFSQFTKTNVCEYARKAQATIAPTLPMQLSANLMMTSVAAAGPRLVYVAALTFSASQAEAMANTQGLSMERWAAQLQDNTRNTVCSMGATAAFVRLGGEVQYLYKSADGRVLFMPLVGRSDCLNFKPAG